MKKRKLAIFDIDGTIFRSSLVIELFEELVKSNIFPKCAKEEVNDTFISWVNRKGDYGDYVQNVVDIYVKYIKNRSEQEIKTVTKRVVETQKHKLYRYTRELIKKLKKENYLLLAISASPYEIVSEFAKVLGFDKSFGSTFEIKNKIYSGNAISLHSQKMLPLSQFIKHNEGRLDLKNSIAVGDTESDIPLFITVEQPIAFNPNSGLLKIAKKKKWRIIIERKDVIYDLKEFKIINI